VMGRVGSWTTGVALLLAMLGSGCAGDYVAKTRGVRQAYQSYDYDRALAGLDPSKAPTIDQLLVLLDRGMLLHAAGRYEESIQVLAQADKLSANLDFTSISEQAVTALSNEREKTYRGEDFEKLMISVLQALNYAQLGRDEDALVEVRRVNERIRKMVSEEKKPYEQLAIARYLGGVLYEDEGNEDDAFIDYYEAYKLTPSSSFLAEPVLRLAKQTGRDQIYEQVKAKFPELSAEPVGKGQSQIVIIVEAGLAPQKESTNKNYDGSSGPQLIAIPMFKDRWAGGAAKVRVDGLEQQASTVTSLSQVAKVHLEDRVGKLVAKQFAAMAVKAGLAAGVGALAKDQRLGVLAFILLNAANVPDLRSWLSLPAEFQVSRFRVTPGLHDVVIQAGGQTTQHPVDVKPGRITVLSVRRY
jgi:hypothetical protein